MNRQIAGAVARAVAGQHGIRAVPGQGWSYNPKKLELTYEEFTVWCGLTYPQWYSILMHEIAHVMFTDPTVKLPEDKDRKEWWLLYNAIEDYFVERELELAYPRGAVYKNLINEAGVAIIQKDWPLVERQIKRGDSPKYVQYMTLIMFKKSGLDLTPLYEIVDEKVASVWDRTDHYIGREDFHDSHEVMEYTLTNFDAYAELLDEQEDEDDGGSVMERAIAVYGSSNQKKDVATQSNGGITREQQQAQNMDALQASMTESDEEHYGDVQTYRDLEKEMRIHTKHLRNKIKPVLREIRARRWQSRQKTGIPDPKRLWQAALPQQKIFQKQADGERTDHYAVTILLDESGSMNGVWHQALASTIMVTEACQQMGIPVRNLRFEGRVWSATNDWVTTHSDTDRARIASRLSGGGTNDVPAVTWAVQEAHKNGQETGRKQLVFMIGDGMGQDDMNSTAADLQRRYGVEVYGIIVNMDGDAEQYPHADMVEDVGDLPRVMQRLLKQYIGKRI